MSMTRQWQRSTSFTLRTVALGVGVALGAAVAAWAAASELLPLWSYRAQDTVLDGVGGDFDGCDLNSDGFWDLAVSASQYDGDEGAVLVFFSNDGALPATPGLVLQEGPPVAGANFGIKAKCAGDVNGDGYADLVVVARSNTANDDSGEVFLYYGGASGLSAFPAWTYSTDELNGERLWEATGVGDVNGDGYADLAVGAQRYDANAVDSGKVELFLGGPAGLGAVADAVLPGEFAGDLEGSDVRGVGDVNGDGYDDVGVVGQYWDNNNNGASNRGRLRIYAGGPSGVDFTAPALVTIEGPTTSARIAAVSGLGDVDGDGYSDMLVYLIQEKGPDGAVDGNDWTGQYQIHYGGPSGPSATPAQVYVGSHHQVYLETGSSSAPGDAGGDPNGDGYADVPLAWPSWDAGTDSNEGKLEWFWGGPSGIAATPDLTFAGTTAGQRLGAYARALGDIDADGYDELAWIALEEANGNTGEGEIFVYDSSRATPAESAATSLGGGQALAALGAAVALAGDVNGDGYGDLLVGAPHYDASVLDEGAAFVYLGTASGIDSTPVWMVVGSNAGEQLGSAVAAAGDVNGDGYADILLGAPLYSPPGATNAGRALLYLGSAAGPQTTPAQVWIGTQVSERLGAAVAAAGDVNADGYGDVLVAAPRFDSPTFDVGRVDVYFGAATGPGAVPNVQLVGTVSGGRFGSALAGLGDLDGDGWGDLLISAPDAATGTVSLFRGGPTGPSAAHWSLSLGATEDRFGAALAALGDVNGDGIVDFAVAAPNATDTLSGQGIVYGFWGSDGAPQPVAADFSFSGGAAGASLGTALAAAGDSDGDGYDDVLVGAPGFLGGNGQARVFAGSATGPTNSDFWSVNGSDVDGAYGSAVAGGGDLNADGYADFVVAAPAGTKGGPTEEGEVFVYLGGPGGVLAGTGLFALGADAQPRAAGAAIDVLRLRLRERVATGRSEARIVADVVQERTVFANQNRLMGGVVDTGLGVTDYTITVTPASGFYRVRARPELAPWRVQSWHVTNRWRRIVRPPFALADVIVDGDDDADGLRFLRERNEGTDPNDPDSDSDGLQDGNEVFVYSTDPLDPDSDDDDLNDGDEVDFYGTEPADADTDHDGMPDGWEVAEALDPLTNDASFDADSDALVNVDEYGAGTSPHDADSDDDGYGDGEEMAAGSDPLDPFSLPPSAGDDGDSGSGGGDSGSGGGGSGSGGGGSGSGTSDDSLLPQLTQVASGEATSVARGARDVVVLKLALATPASSGTWHLGQAAVTVAASGGGNVARDILAVHIVRDVDGDGTVGTADERLGSGTVAAEGRAEIDLSATPLVAATTTHLLLTVDFAVETALLQVPKPQVLPRLPGAPWLPLAPWALLPAAGALWWATPRARRRALLVLALLATACADGPDDSRLHLGMTPLEQPKFTFYLDELAVDAGGAATQLQGLPLAGATVTVE